MSTDHPQSPSFFRYSIFSDIEHEDGLGDVALANTPSSRARDEASQDSYITHDLRTYRAQKVGPLRKQGLRETSSTSSSSRRRWNQTSLPMADGTCQIADKVMSLTTRAPLTPALRLRDTDSQQANCPDQDNRQEEIAVQSNCPASTRAGGTEAEAAVKMCDRHGGQDGSSRRSFSGLKTTEESSFQKNSTTNREIPDLQSAQALMSDAANLEKALCDIRSREGRVGRQSGGFPVSDVETRDKAGTGGNSFADNNIEWSQRSPSQFALGDIPVLHELFGRRSHWGYVSESIGSAQLPLSWSDDMHAGHKGSRGGYLDDGSGAYPSAPFRSPMVRIREQEEKPRNSTKIGIREQEKKPRNSNLSNEHELRSLTDSTLSEMITLGRVGGRSSINREGGDQQKPSAPRRLSMSGILREAEGDLGEIKNAPGADGGSFADVGIERRPSVQCPFMEMDAAEGVGEKRTQTEAEGSSFVRRSFSNMDMLGRAFGRNIDASRERDNRQSSLQSTFLEVDVLGQAQSGGAKSGYVDSKGKRRSSVQSPFLEVDTLKDSRSIAVADTGKRPSAQSLFPQVDKVGAAKKVSCDFRIDKQFSKKSRAMDGNRFLNDNGQKSFGRSGPSRIVSGQVPSGEINSQAFDSGERDGQIDHSIIRQSLSAYINLALLGDGGPAFDINGSEMHSPRQSQPLKADLEVPESCGRSSSGSIEGRLSKPSLLANTHRFGNDDYGGRSFFSSSTSERRPSVNSPLLGPAMNAVVVSGKDGQQTDSGVDRQSSSTFSEIDLLREEFGGQTFDTHQDEAGEREMKGTERQSLPTHSHFSRTGTAEAADGVRSSAMLSSAGNRIGSRNSHTDSGIEEQPSLLSAFEIDTHEVQVGVSNVSTSSSDRQSFKSFAETDSLGEGTGGRTIYTSTERRPSKCSALLSIDVLGSSGNERPALAGLHPPSVSVKGHVLEGGERRSSGDSDSGFERQFFGEISERDVVEVDVSGQTRLNRSNDKKQSSSFLGDYRPGEAERTNQRMSHVDSSGRSVRFSISQLGAQHSEEVDDGSVLISERGNSRWSRASFPLSNADSIGGDTSARDIFPGNETGWRSSSSKCRSLDADRNEGSNEKDDNSHIVDEGWASPFGSDPLLNEIEKSRRERKSDRTYVNSGGSRQASRLTQVASGIDTHGDESGKTRCEGSGNRWRSSMKEHVADGVSEPQRELRQASVIPGRRDTCLTPHSEIDRESELLSERVRGRGSLNHNSRRGSRVVISPSSEAAGSDDSDTRNRDEYGEVSTRGAGTGEDEPSLQRRNSFAAQVGERVPPEWALLLLGCLLGLATGLSVVIFNKGVHFIHDMAWAGTPREGAAWLRLQQLIDIWHRVMLIPVVGGVVVGMMHAVVGILDQVKGSRPPLQTNVIDWLGGAKPAVKAGQAMVTLGTGCSLGPEGPSVDIGKAWAHGLATVMKNNRERRIALVAAGAAAGISAGFNAPVSGMFFAIETVLRPQHAENSPPLTTAMIILASVISSTTSQVLLEETAAFTVPNYELRSAAELPLYLILGGVCGVVSVAFTWMTTYFMEGFEFLRDRIGIPHTVTPAIGGLVTGLVSLKYPGVLYWGFYNVDEILHSGKTATAPGAWLVTQLICAKVFATAFCKGSGLVGGVYAPSLFVGAAVGSVYGTMAGKIVNAAIPGQDTVAHPQAYALVGMAALLAAVCSVPLTSVLLLFELTKDYHILLPLMGGIGVAIWVASVAKPSTEKHFASSATTVGRSFQPLSTTEEGALDVCTRERRVWRRTGSGTEVELCTLDDYEGHEIVSDDELMESVKVSQAMSKTFVKVQPIATVKETIGRMLLKQQRCALVVDENDLIEGIFTFADLESEVVRAAEASAKGDRTLVEVDKMLVAAFCSGNGDNQGTGTDLIVCFPDISLNAALEMMQSSNFKQLPVVARAGKRWQDEGRQVVGLLDRDAIPRSIREEASKRITAMLAKSDEDDDAPLLDTH